MFRISLFVSALLLFSLQSAVPQQANAPSSKNSPYSAIPVEEAKKENPVKSSPESLTRAKKWWALDCEMCHGKNGDGKGETAKEMKLTMMDFTDAATLKDHTDGELAYIIKNGHNDMPAEGPRVKEEEAWDLVNYVRAFAKKKEADPKQQ